MPHITADLRFVRYGIGVGVANIELVFVFTEDQWADTVHWIYPQSDKEVATSDVQTWCASTVEVSKDTLEKQAYAHVYQRDVGLLRMAVDSKKPVSLNLTVPLALPVQQCPATSL